MLVILNRYFYFLLIGLFFFIACKKSANQTPQITTPAATLQGTASFPMGSAVTSYNLLNKYNYFTTLLTEYNSLTADYEMKFDQTEPQQGSFNYTAGDAIVWFAAQHHLRMHGHNLIWHQALPAWVINFKGDSLAWENLFKNHIEGEATHYKGQVASWDVVNEAIRDNNGALRNNDVNAGDGSIWRQHLGPDYIARAFQYTHEADPNALLFYNDYGQEWGGPKLDSMIAILIKFKNRGIPISGVGIQMHIDIHVDTARVSSALKRLAATGLIVHISELDISINPSNDQSLVLSNQLLYQQAALYQFIAESYRANVPAAQRYGITTWEFSDGDSWLVSWLKHKDWPLPFDSDYKKKSAYYSLQYGLTK